ncbi:hypothetical protein KPH14_007864 [Odynerus spinipes]|uniref:Cns1/TTC4 wheel domain-containing protein n=1 Tax=Odynerus spinipes TaxID=1348599 RepID=A0AAD9S0I2_9HYME|nr:hypothetical protein KPH14_007864 [Odynerus spinipes]
MEDKSSKKVWTEEERLELASKLDAELDDYINQLEKKTYTEGWPEDRWQEEMEKHPFFIKKMPEPGEELSPLMEGLQQLKYSTDENTPEELANNYKEDGNFNYKHKKYRMAIISYTEGIKTKCKDQELMAQLYNNRAASHYMLKNYRSSLNDSKQALKLKPNYVKSVERAATCCFHIKDYDQCIELCDRILDCCSNDKTALDLKTRAITAKKNLQRDRRKQEKAEKKVRMEEEKLLSVIKSRGINLESLDGEKVPNLKDLESRAPQVMQSKVHLDENDRLVWPVIFLYPEVQETDFVQNFHEDITIKEQLEELFRESPEWDTKHRYTPDNIVVYFEGKDKTSLYLIDVSKSLGEILMDERFVVRGGTPAFLVFVRDSKAEARFLATYSVPEKECKNK